MGIKYLKLDENGNKVQSHAYDKDAIAYEVSKSRGLSSYITRQMSFGRSPNGRRNRFDIWDQSQYGKGFRVSWDIHVAPRPSQEAEGKIVLSYLVDKIMYVNIGQFSTLKEAELYTMKFAYDFADVKPYFGYHPLFEKEEVTIEDIPNVFTWDDVSRPISITCPVLDQKGIDENKKIAERRLLNKQNRENGMEDTRIMVKVLLNVNLGDLGEAIQSHLENEVSVIDGVGNDGTSTYNIDEVDVKVESTGQIEATFYLERESGKFASVDDLRSEIENQLGTNLTVEVPFEIQA